MNDQDPDETPADPARGTERRARPRDDRSAGDWESIALLRVASRVHSLTAPGPAEPAASTEPGFGWEGDVLRKLSERLRGRGSD